MTDQPESNAPDQRESAEVPTPLERDGVHSPADDTFAAIVEFVHHEDVSFEDLQGALLTLAQTHQEIRNQYTLANDDLRDLMKERDQLRAALAQAEVERDSLRQILNQWTDIKAERNRAIEQLAASQAREAALRSALLSFYEPRLMTCPNCMGEFTDKLTQHTLADAALSATAATDPTAESK